MSGSGARLKSIDASQVGEDAIVRVETDSPRRRGALEAELRSGQLAVRLGLRSASGPARPRRPTPRSARASTRTPFTPNAACDARYADGAARAASARRRSRTRCGRRAVSPTCTGARRCCGSAATSDGTVRTRGGRDAAHRELARARAGAAVRGERRGLPRAARCARALGAAAGRCAAQPDRAAALGARTSRRSTKPPRTRAPSCHR